MGIGIAILLLLAILAITAVATVAAGDSNNTGLIIGASVGAFIVVCIYAAAFILTVSILARLSLLILYFYYLSADYRQICF